MGMHVVVFRHIASEGAGRMAPILESRGVRIEYADLFRPGEAVPDWRSAAGLVFMGGPMSANDDLPYLRQELAILAAALHEDKPVLGVCLGSQLLARAARARVYRNPVKEIGWAPVNWTPAASSDALFHGLEPVETVFHWHGETFDLPAGAVHLAESRDCRHQAFRLGRATYGLQFHLEVTPEMIDDWCRQDSNAADVRELTAPIDSSLHQERLGALSEAVFGRWAQAVGGASQKL
jgi:GMP synthase-like glutamine amidotransferase